jgi:hypothetical protein
MATREPMPGIPVNHCLLTVQQLSAQGGVMHIGACRWRLSFPLNRLVVELEAAMMVASTIVLCFIAGSLRLYH